MTEQQLRERAEAKAEEVLAKYTTEKFGNTDVDPVIFFGSLHKQIISAMIDFHKQELQRIGEVVYVPVSVEDELPEYYQSVPCWINRNRWVGMWRANDGENDLWTITETEQIIIDKPTHWLKKLSLLEVKDLEADKIS